MPLRKVSNEFGKTLDQNVVGSTLAEHTIYSII
jgi:hypothetical protein